MAIPPPPAGLDITESVVATNLPVEAVLRALAYAAVILRFLARQAGRLQYRWDDWFILILAASRRILVRPRCDANTLL
jgi:hypothetical protein